MGREQTMDSGLAFEQAIKEGRLSTNPAHVNYAGHFMHMGGKAFKHIHTRKYLTSTQGSYDQENYGTYKVDLDLT